MRNWYFCVVGGVFLLPLGCSRDTTASADAVEDSDVVESQSVAETIHEIRPAFPEINAMDWDDLLMYTLEHRLPVSGYRDDIRQGLGRADGWERLKRINIVREGKWGEYRGLVVEKILSKVEGMDLDYVQKSVKSAQWHRDVLMDSQESLAAHQLAWSALLNQRLYMSAMDLVLSAVVAAPGTRETKWLLNNLILEFPWATDLVTGIVARHNTYISTAHPAYIAQERQAPPLVEDAFRPDVAFEMDYLRDLPLIHGRGDIIDRLNQARDLAPWQRLRLLQDAMEQFHATRKHILEATERVRSWSCDSRTDVLRIKSYLQEGL